MNPDDKEDKSVPKKQPEKQSSGRVFDVSRPGKAPASPTSKPVILGHKPEAQQAQTAVSGIGEAKPLITRRKIQIMPTGDLKVADGEKPAGAPPESEAPKEEAKPEPTPAEAAPEEEKEAIGAAAVDAATGAPEADDKDKMLGKHLTIEPPSGSEAPKEETEAETPAEEPKPETDAEPKAEASEPAAAEPGAEKTDEDAPETLADELPKDSSSVPVETPTDDKPKPEGEGEEPVIEEPEVKIEPLFDDSGRIVVSQHNHHHHHGAKVALLLLLILVLAVAALDIVLDLGLLNLEGVPHTDFL